MKFAFAWIALFCAGVLGYYSGLNQYESEKIEALTRELSENNAKNSAHKNLNIDLNRSITYAISIANDESMRAQGIKSKGPTTVESALDQARLSPHEADVWQSLSNDTLSSKLRRVLVADHHADQIPGTQLLINNFYEDLKKTPEPSISNLESNLSQLPTTGFPIERATILNIMNLVAGPNEQTKALALNEVTHNIVPPRADPNHANTEQELNTALSSTPDMILPISAHLIFLNNTTNSDEALNGTVQGIVAQPDHGIRRALASQFVAQYPDLRNQLNSALIEHGIQPTFMGQ